MSHLQLFLFGSPRLLLDGTPLAADRRKAVALLAYLVIERRPVTRPALAALLWPDFDSASAYAYLRRALWELNHVLGEGWLAADRDQVTVQPGADLGCDVWEFHTLLTGCPPTTDPACLPALEQAAALYQGDFMAGFALPDAPAFEEWQLVQAEELSRRFSSVLERLSAAGEQAGQLAQAVAAARRWLGRDSLNEAAHRRLMQLFARQGQVPAALRQYEQCVQLLADELGVEPAPETTALADQIRRNTAGGSPAPQSRPRPGLPPPETLARLSLPTQLTPFIGRRDELEDIRRLLADPACRLLTLLGPGGTGKTRLAIQAGLEAGEAFADGACFVPLAGLPSPDGILPTVGRALGLPTEEGRDSLQGVRQYLRARRLLLILDNFEHLVSDESAALAGELAAAGPWVKLLVTSRQNLGLPGEQIFLVSGMRIPADLHAIATPQELEEFSAVRLFVQCARRQRPDFAIDLENMATIQQLVSLLQGVPLAIELAAGWVQLLTPAEILKELQSSLDFLETSQRGVPERQRSLRAVFESSWNLLSPSEAAIYNALSVFKDGFDRPAAQAVAGAGLRDLSALEQKSLLQRAGSGRYATHPLLAEFAVERLRQDTTRSQHIHQRHCEYFTHFVAEAGRTLQGKGQEQAYDAITADLENINAAWRWAVEQRQFERLEQTFFGLFYYYSMGAYQAGSARLLDDAIQALETVEQPGQWEKVLLACLLTMRAGDQANFSSRKTGELLRRALSLVQETGGQRQMGIFYSVLADNYAVRVDQMEGLRLLEDALAIQRQAGDEWVVAMTQRMLSGTLDIIGRRPEAIPPMQEAVEIARRLEDRISLAYGLMRLGEYNRHILADHSQADRYFEESLAIAESLGQRVTVANVHWAMGDIFSVDGKFEQANTRLEESKKIYQDLGMLPYVASMASWQSINAVRLGDFEVARALRLTSLQLSQDIEDNNGVLWSKWELGDIERQAGNFSAARRLYEDALHLFEENRSFSLLPFYYRGLGQIALAEHQPDQARELFQRSLEEARKGLHTWAISYALSQLGRAETALGQTQAARPHFQEALKLSFDLENPGLVLIALAGLAGMLVAEGRPRPAAELAAFVEHYRSTWQETRLEAGRILARAADSLPADEATEARQAGRQLELISVLERVLHVLGPADSSS